MKSKKLKQLIATVMIATTVAATIPDAINPIVAFASSDLTYVTEDQAKSAGFNFTLSNGVYQITRYTGSSTDVTIPSQINGKNVTSIGTQAFSERSGLTSITIPSSVTSIGISAFYGCSGLTSISIPSSVTSIGNYTFYNCSGLTSISIPSSVTSIGVNAFMGCSGLTSISIPSGVTSIGRNTFTNCRGLTSISIPSSVTSIDYQAFYGCSGLTSISIPSSVTSIGSAAFLGCSGVTSISIPSSVTSIGDYAFYYCSGLTSISIPSSVTSIGNNAFSGIDNNAIFYVPDANTEALVQPYKSGNIQIILSDADLTLASKTATTATLSFPVQTGATSVKVQQSSDGGTTWTDSTTGTLDATSTSATVTGLTAGTSYEFRLVMNNDFYGNILDVTTDTAATVNSVSVSAATSSVDQGNTDQLTASVDVTGGAAQTVTWSSSDINNKVTVDSNGLVNVAADAAPGTYTITATSTADTSKKATTTITVTGLKYALKSDDTYEITGYTGTSTTVTIPSQINGKKVTSIGDYAFYNCSGLTSISIPSSVTSIGNAAFYWCNSLTSITIPDSVTSIGNRAFYCCSGLTSITIPNSATSISDYAFMGCTGLTSITILGNITSIGAGAFNSCSSLTSITIPNSVTSIGDSAFNSCSSLTSIIIPNSVTSIGDNVFWACSSLTSIAIPDSITSIGEDAFKNINNNAIFYVADSNIAGLVQPYKTDGMSIIPLVLASPSKTDTTATLSFEAITGATSVKVQKSTDGTTWSDAATGALDATSTSATVTGLTGDTSYKFRLVMNDDFYGSPLDVTTDTAATPAYTVSASVASSSPKTGADNTVTLTVKDSTGSTDTTFTGTKAVTVSGYTEAPDGTYGKFNQTRLTGVPNTINVDFTNGVATPKLVLNNAASQDVTFSIAGVNTPLANIVTIAPVPDSADSSELTQDITAPTANGGQFAKQPKVTLKDWHGNICVNDNSTQVRAIKKDGGAWTLTGTTTETVSNGVATFSDLGATNAEAVTGAQLAFNFEDMSTTSGTVNLPASETLGTLNPSAGAGNGKVTLSAESAESGYDYYYTKGGSSATAPSVNDNINTISGAQTFTTDTDIEGANGTAIYVQVYKVETATGKVKAYGETSATPAAPASTPAYTVAAAAASSSPTAGADNVVTLTVKDSTGSTDTTFTGTKAVTVSGYTAAPNGSYGSLNYNQITQASTTRNLNFLNGVATLNLRLTNAAAQNISFSVEGVNTPNADAISITPVPATAQTETLTQDITAPSSNGGRFAQQPIVTIKDLYGNICTNDNTTQVYVGKFGEGDWTLTGTTRATVNNGIARFDDLGATNEAAVTGAQLEFYLSDVGISSGSVNLPAPAATPAVNSVSVTPATASVVQGHTEQLAATVDATGGAAQTVTWSSSDTNGKVAVDPTTGLVTVAADAEPGDYTIIATSTVDGTKTGAATITVTAAPAAPVAPSITTQSSDKTVTTGNNTSFTVEASGSSLTYQWKVDKGDGNGFVDVVNDSIYSGATTDILNLTNATVEMNNYKYEVVVSGITGSPVTSNVAKLIVNPAESNEVNVTEVSPIDSITVDNGTTRDDLDLPDTVDVTLSDSTTTSAQVRWGDATPEYDGGTAGTYVFSGTLRLPDGITNPTNLKASVAVNVRRAENGTTPAAVTVESVESLDNITVDNGTERSDIDLPDTVDVTLSDSTTTSAQVRWEDATPEYNGDRAGTYIFTGRLRLPDGITNPANLKATMVVNVRQAENNTTPSAVTVESVETLDDITVNNGTTRNALNLPNTVDVTLNDGTTTSAQVRWEEVNPEYNGNAAGTYEFTGILTLPDGITNPHEYTAKVNVIVKGSSSSSHHHHDSNTNSTTTSDTTTNTDTHTNTNTNSVNTSTTSTKTDSISSSTEWKQDTAGNWYLEKDNGDKTKGWKLVDNKWYFFDNNTGSMVTGWYKSESGDWTYDGKDTVGQWFHLESNGKMTTGWLKDTDGNWYYLCDGSDYGALGVMKTGWQRIDSKWYYFNSNGTMASDTTVDGYALGSDGTLI